MAANQTITMGAILTVDGGQALFTVIGHIGRGKRRMMKNMSATTIFINWKGGTVDTTGAAGDNKGSIAQNGTLEIPMEAKTFTMCTAGGTSTVNVVEGTIS